MTDSTTNAQSADGEFDVGSSVDDLFGEIESDGESGDDQRAETDDGDGSDAVEDRTAADVFDQLRTKVGDESGADDILADESPDDIIASADDPDPEPDATVDADLLADDDEIADLLLTGRSKETDGEFLWIDPADDGGADGIETGDDGRLEERADATPAWESNDGTDDATESVSDDTATAGQPDADESVTDDADGDVEASPTPNDTEAEPEPATSSTPEIISDDGSETVSDSSDDGESDLEGDETAPEPAADGDEDEESDRADADDAPSGPLSKVRATLGGLF